MRGARTTQRRCWASWTKATSKLLLGVLGRASTLAGSSPGTAALARAARKSGAAVHAPTVCRAPRTSGRHGPACAPRVDGVPPSRRDSARSGPLALGPRPRGDLRTDPDLLPRLLADPATRVLELVGDRVAVEVVARPAARPRCTCGRRSPPTPAALALFLGEDEEGTAYVAVVADDRRSRDGEPRQWRTLRAGGRRPRRPRRRPVHDGAGPRQLARQHTHCPRCGAPTAPSRPAGCAAARPTAASTTRAPTWR